MDICDNYTLSCLDYIIYFNNIMKSHLRRYILAGFIIVFSFVVLVSIFKITAKPKYFYAKALVMVNKERQKPDLSYVKLIKKGDKIKDFMGNTVVEVLSARYYPSEPINKSNTYDFALILKLKNDNLKQFSYSFNKTEVKVGSTLSLNFPKILTYGEIFDVKGEPFDDKYEDKIVYFFRYEGNSVNNFNLYENIRIGDYYFDGEDETIEILDKTLMDIEHYAGNINYYNSRSENLKHIVIKVRMKLLKDDGDLIYGKNTIVERNKIVEFITKGSVFEWFVVGKIE